MLKSMADEPETGQAPAKPGGVAGPAMVVERAAPFFPDGSLRAALLAYPNAGQWMRTGAFVKYQSTGGKPPRTMVVALTNSELVLLDAHVRRGQTSLGRRFSRWAAWPLRSLKVDVGHARSIPALSIAVVDTGETFDFSFGTGMAVRGNRAAADLIETAIEPLFPPPREEDSCLPPVHYDPKDRVLL